LNQRVNHLQATRAARQIAIANALPLVPLPEWQATKLSKD